MPDLGPVAWPPAPIRTERLVLRAPEVRDRAAFIELEASPEVSAYLGGPKPRDELEREMPAAPERLPGLFAVELDGATIGQVILKRAKVSSHLSAQTANARSMRLAAKLGFTEVERFHAWDAEQWFGLRPPVRP